MHDLVVVEMNYQICKNGWEWGFSACKNFSPYTENRVLHLRK